MVTSSVVYVAYEDRWFRDLIGKLRGGFGNCRGTSSKSCDF